MAICTMPQPTSFVHLANKTAHNPVPLSQSTPLIRFKDAQFCLNLMAKCVE
jgi:hypothetical protein